MEPNSSAGDYAGSMVTSTHSRIYPPLSPAAPTTPSVLVAPSQIAGPVLRHEVSQQQFRLSEISRLRTYLENEAIERGRLRKKYARSVAAVHVVDGSMTVAGMGLGCAGVGLLTTVIAAPIVVGLEAAALACGVCGIAAKFVERRLAAKARKHDEICVLAQAKGNTIASHVSSALRDGEISDEEFRLVVDEVAKYEDMKAAIRQRGRAAHGAVSLREIDEATKNELLQRGREEARASILRSLGAAVPVGTAPAPQR